MSFTYLSLDCFNNRFRRGTKRWLSNFLVLFLEWRVQKIFKSIQNGILIDCLKDLSWPLLMQTNSGFAPSLPLDDRGAGYPIFKGEHGQSRTEDGFSCLNLRSCSFDHTPYVMTIDECLNVQTGKSRASPFGSIYYYFFYYNRLKLHFVNQCKLVFHNV